MKAKIKRYKSVEEFGRGIGLSDLDMQLIRQKKKIVEKLKKARLDQELSQAQLATRVGSKQPAIARMESGAMSEVSMDFLAKIALALDVSISIRPQHSAA